jgi:hypothetical protein
MEDVFQGFGAAAYNSQVMERKLTHLLSAICAARDPSSADQVFDHAIQEWETKTLGRIIKVLGQVIELPEGLNVRLERALKSRNDLMHNFFWVHAEDELSQSGRSAMLLELAKSTAIFYELAVEIEAVTKAFMSTFTLAAARTRGLPDSLREAIDDLLGDAERNELDVMRKRAKWRDGQLGT